MSEQYYSSMLNDMFLAWLDHYNKYIFALAVNISHIKNKNKLNLDLNF